MPQKKPLVEAVCEKACKYELERDERIARNLEALGKLGFASKQADGLHTKLSTYQPTKPANAPKCSKRKLEPQVPTEPVRVSKRLQGTAPLGKEEIQAVLEEEERQAEVGGKASARRGLPLNLGKMSINAPFSLRTIGTTIWDLGEIHRGAWAQQYWSNTGCLYHHAYPVGFRASKTMFNRTYQMCIEAGPKGPIFKVIDEHSGVTFPGTSPTAPWTAVCKSLRTGQRISGPLFFGFSDILTMQAIAALYTPEELEAAQQGRRLGSGEPTAAEKAAKEFQAVDGIGEATAMTLALTTALGGSQHESLAALSAWASAGENRAKLQDYLLNSEEMQVTTRKWPAWRARMVPRILTVLCGSVSYTTESSQDLPSSSSHHHGGAEEGDDMDTKARQPYTGQNHLPGPEKNVLRHGGSGKSAICTDNASIAKDVSSISLKGGAGLKDKENLRGSQAGKQRVESRLGTASSKLSGPLLQKSMRQRKSNPLFADFVM